MHRVHAVAIKNGMPDPEMTETLRSRMRAEQTELHIRHYEDAQLAALLDFYATDMGKSILASQESLAKEIASGTRLESGAMNEGSPVGPITSVPFYSKPET